MAINKNPRRNTTIKDIALEAGVSIATVSKALNEGKSGMAEKTREKILETSRRLNYFPNLQARGLVKKRPDFIGMIIPQTSELAFSLPSYSEMLKGIGKKTNESGQNLVFSFAERGSYVRLYHQSLVAGIIVMASRIGDPGIEEAYKMKVPLVLIPGDPTHQGIPSVDVDNIGGAFQAVDYLAGRLGHRRIAFLNGAGDSKYSSERLVGYRRAFKKYHLPYQGDLVLESDFTQQGGYAGMKTFLSMKPRPTAVLMINDFSAMGALRAAKEMACRVPEDVAIVGFGDVPFASMTAPPLTTVREPFQRVGQEAVEMLLKIIRGQRLSRKHLVLPVELVIRESAESPRTPEPDKNGDPPDSRNKVGREY